MSVEALDNVIKTLEDYVASKTTRVAESEYFAVQEKLIKSGLEMPEAESVLMHTHKVEDIISAMKKDLGLFKKANKFHEDSLEKELEEAQALVATKLAELAKLRKAGGP
jgi:hypothetical protein